MSDEILKYLLIIALIFIILSYIDKVYTALKEILSQKFSELKFKIKHIAYLSESAKREKEAIVLNYYGLFEFEFENCSDKENLKKELCLDIGNKIKTKYKGSSLRLTATDKVFFNCSDFSKLEVLIDDFLQLYSFYASINKKRQINTNLKFSVWAGSGHVNLQRAYNVLSELNSLNFLNQVIANEKVYNRCKQEGLYVFKFNPYGLIKLSESDEEFELYKLQRLTPSNYKF